MTFKNSVRTSKRTPHFTITKINWVMLFKEIIIVDSEKHTETINRKCRVTDCYSGWYIYLPFVFKGLKHYVPASLKNNVNKLHYVYSHSVDKICIVSCKLVVIY
jgi:hypothetical protein